LEVPRRYERPLKGKALTILEGSAWKRDRFFTVGPGGVCRGRLQLRGLLSVGKERPFVIKGGVISIW